MRFILIMSSVFLIAYWFAPSPIAGAGFDITGSIGLFIFIAASEILREIRKWRG